VHPRFHHQFPSTLAPAAAAVHVLLLAVCFKPLLRLQSPEAQNHGLLVLEDM
jgi:hypothetical protein